MVAQPYAHGPQYCAVLVQVAATPAQTPLVQTSLIVAEFWSSQATPALARFEHLGVQHKVAVQFTPGVQGLVERRSLLVPQPPKVDAWFPHVAGVPTQMPPLAHVSETVLALPSSHGTPAPYRVQYETQPVGREREKAVRHLSKKAEQCVVHDLSHAHANAQKRNRHKREKKAERRGESHT